VPNRRVRVFHLHPKTLIEEYDIQVMASPIQIALKGQKMALRKTVAATLNALTSSTVDEQCMYSYERRKNVMLTQQPSFFFLSPNQPAQ
jgi:hypothetical protein